ncbi:hypothetical protein MRB53_040435 [Persea americana]|nr:hypothetical protein MRB53_040435 [Persea americana]
MIVPASAPTMMHEPITLKLRIITFTDKHVMLVKTIALKIFTKCNMAMPTTTPEQHFTQSEYVAGAFGLAVVSLFMSILVFLAGRAIYKAYRRPVMYSKVDFIEEDGKEEEDPAPAYV